MFFDLFSHLIISMVPTMKSRTFPFVVTIEFTGLTYIYCLRKTERAPKIIGNALILGVNLSDTPLLNGLNAYR